MIKFLQILKKNLKSLELTILRRHGSQLKKHGHQNLMKERSYQLKNLVCN
jgi:hypothetical protein